MTAAARDSQILRIIPVLVIVCLVSLPVRAKYGGPSGPEENPSQIWTAWQTNDSDIAAHHGYAIITTSEIEASSSILPDFVAHKESLGYVVSITTEKDFGGGVGDEAAENIRAWLQSHYLSNNIEYVLLIGDPRPETGEIPMKLLHPYRYESTNDVNDCNSFDFDETVPSDLYYADLSGNWDLDRDGYFGEWGDDFGYGGVDREWEVLVGRIPYYADYDEPNDLDRILSKIIHYEDQDGEQILWRKSALLAMNVGSGSCRFGEEIVHDILVPAEWSWYRLYREESANACEPAPFPEEIIPTGVCDYRQLPQIWANGKFGLVVWAAHGGCDDPPVCENVAASCLIYSNQVSQLNDDFPSFTFQASCSNAVPEYPNNITYALLKHGAICTIGATRVSKYTSQEPFALGHSAMGMAYAYISRLVTGMTCGQALFGLKHRMTLESPDYWLCNVQYNIYGDPSLRLDPLKGRTVYVDDNANGDNDGSSWANAYNCLQDGLSLALPGDEIRVAQGVYKPDQGNGIMQGDRTVSFHLMNGVVIRGGYAGLGARDPNARDIELYQTILSGDLSGNDVEATDPRDFLNEPTRSENSHHVVRVGPGVCDASILDGLIVTRGYADSTDANGCGGGIYIDQAHPRLVDCNITSNVAAGLGGGIYDQYGSPILTWSTFSDNSSSSGGGMYNHKASPLLSHTTLVRNSARNGGGIYSLYSSPRLTNSIISNNSASWYGGGLYNAASNSIITNCTISGNSAPDSAGICNNSCRPWLTNCIVWGNRPQQISDYFGGPALISYSDIQGGWPGETNIDSDPNFADAENGDFHLNSQTGRWDQGSQSWVFDSETSLCIDAGDPNSPIGDEPIPNGGQINMGAYGGTAEASKSPWGE